MSNSTRAVQATVADEPAPATLAADNPVAGRQQVNDLATRKAKCAVAEYLRDLGLRDPDLVAKESQRIVGNAQRQLSPADANNESQLCEGAVRLTVKQLELWLEVLAAQSGRPDHSQRLGSVIAARLFFRMR